MGLRCYPAPVSALVCIDPVKENRFIIKILFNSYCHSPMKLWCILFFFPPQFEMEYNWFGLPAHKDVYYKTLLSELCSIHCHLKY